MDPERIEPDPRELDALQRAAESVAEIEDGPTPETVSIPEIPAAAEQPDLLMQAPPAKAQDVQAPEIAAPILDDEVMAPVLDEIPDAPKRRKLSAQQKRNGQVEPPEEPFRLPPEPDAKDDPRQQPPEPIDPEELQAAARQANAIDDDGNINVGKMQGNQHGNPDEAKPDDNPVVQAAQQAGDKIGDVAVAVARVLQQLSDRLANIETIVTRLENGNMRRQR